MGMFMEGAVSAEDRVLLKSPYTFFRSVAEGDEADGVHYEKGGSGLGDAVSLWMLAGSERAAQLRQLRDEVVTEDNLDEDKGYRMSVEQVKRAAELLDGLEEAMHEYVDDGWNVRPEKLDYVRQKDPYLIKRSQDADGTVYERITDPLWEATWAARFLKVAARLHREVWLG